MQDGLSVPGIALSWVAHLMTGSIATAVAVVAVASLGFAMIQGRLVWRDAMRVALGCFVLLGAPMLAGDVLHAALGERQAFTSSVPRPAVINLPASPPQYDPYAGAALPH